MKPDASLSLRSSLTPSIICLLVIALGLAAPGITQAAESGLSPTLITEQERKITVNGRARVEIPAAAETLQDRQFTIDLNIQIDHASSLKTALELDRKLVAAIKQTAGERLVSTTTNWFSISPLAPMPEEMPLETTVKETRAGNEGSQQADMRFSVGHSLALIIKVADMDAATDLAYALMELSEKQGVVMVNNVSEFSYQFYGYPENSTVVPDPATEAKALEIAIANATAKAETVAKLLNVRLGPPILFNEMGNVVSMTGPGSSPSKSIYALEVSVSFALLPMLSSNQR